jgi:outer membrane lipoprotein-sorting protein
MSHWLLIVLSVLAQPDNEAERLFQRMEQELAKARALECVFEVKAEAGEGTDFKGRLLLAEGNKMRLEMEGPQRGARTKMVVVSDGTKLVAAAGGARKELPELPKSLNREVVKVLARAGGRMLGRGVITPEPSEGQEAKGKRFADRLHPSGFKLGKKERLDGREAQVIEYELRVEGEADSPTVAVWLDTKSNLPLRRTLSDKRGSKLIYAETYTKMMVGGKIDEKEFELPK